MINKSHRIFLVTVLLSIILTGCSSKEEALKQTKLKLQHRVVLVQIGDSEQCTGTIVSTGLVLTASHCVRSGGNTLNNISVNWKPAKVERIQGELALLQAETASFEPIPTKTCEQMDRIFQWGYPVFHGEIPSRTIQYNEGTVIAVTGYEVRNSVAIMAGNSGSPIFSEDGKLCGMQHKVWGTSPSIGPGWAQSEAVGTPLILEIIKDK